MNYTKHKFNIFPDMLENDFKMLKQDIETKGYDNSMPITLFQGKIIDGWHRYKACEELQIKPVFVDFKGSESEAIEFIMRTNKRRNLTSSQWATIAVEAEDIISVIKAEAKARQVLGGKNKVVELIPQAKTHEKVAEIFNTNAKYIQEATKLKKEEPELYKQVQAGTKTITEAKKEVNVTKKRETLLKESVELPKDIFQVIYADPAWEYSNSGFSMSAENQYPTMKLEKIKELNPKTSENSVCFLWVTNPLLIEGLEVLKSWGFEYKTNFVWIKDKHTAGFYIYGQHEILLIGTKGSMLPIGDKFKSIIKGENKIHSKKPDVVYEMIEQMYPKLKYLELFARNSRKGWVSWGNQCE